MSSLYLIYERYVSKGIAKLVRVNKKRTKCNRVIYIYLIFVKYTYTVVVVVVRLLYNFMEERSVSKCTTLSDHMVHQVH